MRTIVTPKPVAALVSKAVFDRVQSVLTRKSKPKNAPNLKRISTVAFFGAVDADCFVTS